MSKRRCDMTEAGRWMGTSPRLLCAARERNLAWVPPRAPFSLLLVFVLILRATGRSQFMLLDQRAYRLDAIPV